MNVNVDTPPVGGACAGSSVSLFYPDPRTRSITPEMRKALNLCRGCRVLSECAEYGINHEMHGIWGGLTERQRVVIRRERNITVQIPGYADPAAHRMKK